MIQEMTMEDVANRFYILEKLIVKKDVAVFKCRENETENMVALKRIPRYYQPSEIKQLTMKELRMQRLCIHRHILQVHGMCDTSSYFFLITELAEGGDLFNKVLSEKLEECLIKRLFFQLASAMSFLHDRYLAHGDIKPENILLDAACSNVKLADFGLCNFADERPSGGTHSYIAPEIAQWVLDDHTFAVRDLRPNDVWAFGITLFFVLTKGDYPWKSYFSALLREIVNGDVKFPDCIPPLAADLLRSIFVADPTARITSHAIEVHPWFCTT